MFAFCRNKIRALRADVPVFPESPSYEMYKKKIPKMTIRLPGVPVSKSGFLDKVDKMYPLSGKSSERNIQEKGPGDCENSVHGVQRSPDELCS
jgi:hypothetical protein